MIRRLNSVNREKWVAYCRFIGMQDKVSYCKSFGIYLTVAFLGNVIELINAIDALLLKIMFLL